MRGAVRPSKRRAKRHRHLSLSARDSEWAVVSRNAARLGLSKARYLVGLVERDAAEEEDRGPFMALAPEEQRALLEAVRAIHVLMMADAADDEAPARETGAASPAEEPGPSAPASDPPAAAGEGSPDTPAPEPDAPAGEPGTPNDPAPEPGDPAPRQPRLL